MLLIGLGHRARHGKDFTARAMIYRAVSQYGLDARQYGFADALKAHCRVAFGMRRKDGPLLQLVGTDLYRRQQPNIWVDVLMAQLEEQKPAIAIIVDLRFPNEAEAIKARGGYVIKVERLRDDGSLWLCDDRDPHHASEEALTDYDDWDWAIRVKDGNLARLEAHAIDAIEYFIARAERERV